MGGGRLPSRRPVGRLRAWLSLPAGAAQPPPASPGRQLARPGRPPRCPGGHTGLSQGALQAAAGASLALSAQEPRCYLWLRQQQQVAGLGVVAGRVSRKGGWKTPVGAFAAHCRRGAGGCGFVCSASFPWHPPLKGSSLQGYKVPWDSASLGSWSPMGLVSSPHLRAIVRAMHAQVCGTERQQLRN